MTKLKHNIPLGKICYVTSRNVDEVATPYYARH
jgi:hypothetical protein